MIGQPPPSPFSGAEYRRYTTFWPFSLAVTDFWHNVYRFLAEGGQASGSPKTRGKNLSATSLCTSFSPLLLQQLLCMDAKSLTTSVSPHSMVGSNGYDALPCRLLPPPSGGRKQNTKKADREASNHTNSHMHGNNSSSGRKNQGSALVGAGRGGEGIV